MHLNGRALAETHSVQFPDVAYVVTDLIKKLQSKTPTTVTASLKYDTRACVDQVSRDFLLRSLALDESAFEPIPEEKRHEVIGFDGKINNPEFHIELEYFQDSHGSMKRNDFFIVDSCPWDIILSTSNFLEKASQRLLNFQITARPQKPNGKIDYAG